MVSATPSFWQVVMPNDGVYCHAWGTREERVDPGVRECITQRPSPVCTCGVYNLHWKRFPYEWYQRPGA